MAGLWEHWQDDRGNELESCTILTTEPNELIGELHDRMPVILNPDSYDAWLDSDNEKGGSVRALCRPFPSEQMMYQPVSRHVNQARNEGPACIAEPTRTPDDTPPGETPMLF